MIIAPEQLIRRVASSIAGAPWLALGVAVIAGILSTAT
jgi:hypothetical protein